MPGTARNAHSRLRLSCCAPRRRTMLAARSAIPVASKRFSGGLGVDHPYVSGFVTATALDWRRGSADRFWPNRRRASAATKPTADRRRDARNTVVAMMLEVSMPSAVFDYDEIRKRVRTDYLFGRETRPTTSAPPRATSSTVVTS